MLRITGVMTNTHSQPTLLILDEDAEYVAFLGASFQKRGFAIAPAYEADRAISLVDEVRPDAAILELVIGDDNGLDVLEHLQRICPQSRAIILTGFGDISTAVSAVKLVLSTI